jgi:hypothetical protein
VCERGRSGTVNDHEEQLMHDRRARAVPRRRRRPHLAALVGAFALTLAVAACAGGARDGGVASLSGPGQTTTTTTPSAADAKQAALNFARCMRQRGIDMPDPKVSGNGELGLGITAGPGAMRPDDPKFKAAQQACQKYLPNGGKATKPNPEQVRQALQFARCMRQHGIDMPDPNPSGGMTVRSDRGGNGGPRPDDPRFKAAQEACKQYMPKGGMVTNSD